MQPLVPEYIHGASLQMWAEYFPEAQIYGCDIRPDLLVNTDRIFTVACDQYDAAQLTQMAETFEGDSGGFEIIIDDGCHHPLAQTITFHTLWKYLEPGGVYVIEDVGYPEIIQKATGGTVHTFRKGGRWDDVVVVKKKVF